MASTQAVSPLLAKILHVRRTELGRTLQVAGFAIVLGWAMYTAFNATQSIFLNRSGPHSYPLFFIVLALTAWPVVAVHGALTSRLGVGNTFRVTLAANVVAAIAIFTAYSQREDSTVAFAAYVVYSVAFEVVMLSFWSFMSQHFNVLEGKRIFPVIAAASSVGYILAGLTTTVVAVIATEPLVFVWAFGCAAALLILIGLERTLFRPAFVDDADQLQVDFELERRRHGVIERLQRSIEHLTGSRLVLAIVVLALVLQVASRTGDYLVALLFVSATHNNLQALTILIGDAWLASYVVQLAVSLFVAPWVLERLGVKNAILVLPIFTLVGFAAVAINPVLVSALFLFVVRNGLQTGLNDPAQTVLAGALPAQAAPKLQFLLDNVVLPVSALSSGLGLLLVQPAITSSVRSLAMIGIGIAVLFILGAAWVKSLYVSAIYARLRTHALSLADFQRAVGRPTPAQVAELQGFIRRSDEKTKGFAAAALARSSPEAFAAMVPELLAAREPILRRLALQMAPPDRISREQLEAARDDEDGWVRAAAAIGGVIRAERLESSEEILRTLAESESARDRAAAVWAAASLADDATVVISMRDADAGVRLEAIRSFARMKGRVRDVAESLVACLRDPDLAVRREALSQAIRWTPPPDYQQLYAEALAEGLASSDRDVRRLAAEAMATQAPEALNLTLPLLLAHDDTSAAAVEALMRSGRPELYRQARRHLAERLSNAVQLAALSARVAGAMHRVDGDVAAGYALLRIGLDDYVRGAIDSGLAAMRALHSKRGFATVERGLESHQGQARVEALETLLNFGPGWLAGPLARLLEPESFAPVLVRPLSQAELEGLADHSDRWVRDTADAAVHGLNEQMQELIALKRVPLFSTLTLDQLSSIDRLLVTRHYVKGETVFRKGDPGAELFMVVEGELRVHLDHDGQDVTLVRHGPGGVLGEMSVFDEQPRSANAQATVDTTVRVLRRDRLHAIVNEHPEVLLEFIRNLSQRLRAMDEKLEAVEAPVPIPQAPIRP